jgi:hypothetical protein
VSTIIQTNQLRTLTQGILVSRATATVAADQDLFSIDGGRIILLGFIGEVTTAIGAGSQDLEIDFDPDDGGSNVALSTLVLVDAAPTGQYFTLNTTAGGALVSTLDVAYNAILATPIVLGAGDIVLDVTGTEAGSVKWDLLYVPLDNGAVVTAS